jgi:hypothetical protein
VVWENFKEKPKAKPRASQITKESFYKRVLLYLIREAAIDNQEKFSCFFHRAILQPVQGSPKLAE